MRETFISKTEEQYLKVHQRDIVIMSCLKTIFFKLRFKGTVKMLILRKVMLTFADFQGIK